MADRDPKTEALRDEIYRRMSGREKIAIAMRMREEALQMVRDSIRRRRPDISEDDLEFEVRKRYLPSGMAELTEPLRRERERHERAESLRSDPLVQVVGALEQLGIPYVVVGSFASTYWGRPRQNWALRIY